MGLKSDLLRMLVAVEGGKSAGIGGPSRGPKWRSGREQNSHGFLRARGSKSGDSLSVSPELASP